MIEAEAQNSAPSAGTETRSIAAAQPWRWTLAALAPAVAALWFIAYLGAGSQSAEALPASLLTVIWMASTSGPLG